MALEPIKRRPFSDPEEAAAQEAIVRAVEADPDFFIQRYFKDRRSFDGRYISADLFKETFDLYRASKESRAKYNNPAHNAAAVLSAELFRRTLADTTCPERDTVVFITGIPGAGKTTSVIVGGEMPSSFRLIFEGQLVRPETTLPKIQQVLDAGLKPLIIAVHALPEDALRNTRTRLAEYGRGASIEVMAFIQGNLPAGLRAVHERFGEAVELLVFDYRDRAKPQCSEGWGGLSELESEGSYEHIKNRLTAEFCSQPKKAKIAASTSAECFFMTSNEIFAWIANVLNGMHLIHIAIYFRKKSTGMLS